MNIRSIISAVLFILLNSFYAASQSCLPDGITFTSQAQIDNFSINYPGCTEIEGDVFIENIENLTNLDGLSNVTSIGGDLTISFNPNLTNIDGLTLSLIHI